MAAGLKRCNGERIRGEAEENVGSPCRVGTYVVDQHLRLARSLIVGFTFPIIAAPHRTKVRYTARLVPHRLITWSSAHA